MINIIYGNRRACSGAREQGLTCFFLKIEKSSDFRKKYPDCISFEIKF